MMTVIIGGSGSGKSAYAEEYTITHSEGKKMYYLATMQVYDEEGQRKVERHRELRKGKGFFTVEQPRSLCEAAELFGAEEKTVLLECMSNLVANEMFFTEPPKPAYEAAETVVKEVELLKEAVSHLVVVTNNVFEDGIPYDETTTAYMWALGSVNEKLAAAAEEVIEVVVGIPVFLKKGE
ncbi:MAG: bifunctional adenosylcobinamide kinase/adenosylcobinamide-phosphate guanylyltransferase [Lachnospiraceae bacterium]|nr:bifunctional adenosylcobinamide kinase/adenosylcobinamide-phosphate guanylyltransferase [Lachnospiraceae bacterium]